MSATRFNDAVNALLARYAAAPAFEGKQVYDGARAVTWTAADFIVVGHDGSLVAGPGGGSDLNPDALAGTFTQADIDMPDRQETGYVNCVIVSWTGDSDDVSGTRQRASDLLQAAEDAAGANGGYDGTGLMFAGTSDGRFINLLSQAGLAVILAYRVAYSTEWAL